MTRSVALNLANAALRIVAVCLALLAASIPGSHAPLISLSPALRVLIAAVGCMQVVAAVMMIDWVVDSFGDAEWTEIDAVASALGQRRHTERFNFFLDRSALFGGGYVFFAASLALLSGGLAAAVSLRTGGSSMNFIASMTATIVATGAVLAKLMTRRLPIVAWLCVLLFTLVLVSLAWLT